MKLTIENGPEHMGNLISFKLTGTPAYIKQVVKEYQDQKIFFVGNSKAAIGTVTEIWSELERCCISDDTPMKVYLLLDEKQAMLMRLSNNIR
jgi:hypothetical protein